jgi:hypothetical protein
MGSAVGAIRVSGRDIPITTIDTFVREHNETIGFFKIDTEGGGLGMIKGAIKTLRTQRPIFGLACYHEWEEVFEVPRLIRREFPDYDYKFHMHGPTHRQSCLNELTFYAYPRSLAWNES